MANKKEQKHDNIPQKEIDSLARALLPAIQKLFESDEGKKEFEEWKAKRVKGEDSK